MRALLKDEKGKTLVYASKKDWRLHCAIHGEHKTPFEAFECCIRNSVEYEDMEVVWVKEK